MRDQQKENIRKADISQLLRWHYIMGKESRSILSDDLIFLEDEIKSRVKESEVK